MKKEKEMVKQLIEITKEEIEQAQKEIAFQVGALQNKQITPSLLGDLENIMKKVQSLSELERKLEGQREIARLLGGGSNENLRDLV